MHILHSLRSSVVSKDLSLAFLFFTFAFQWIFMEVHPEIIDFADDPKSNSGKIRNGVVLHVGKKWTV